MNSRSPVCRFVPSTLLAALALCAPAAAQLKISQIYGGGGNTLAPVSSDYVEIYNPTGAGVTMTNWSIQYAAAAGSTWQVATLNATVGAGQYFLVQLTTNTTSLAPALPTADSVAAPSIDMSATTGKVALVTVNTPLTGATPTDATIDDFVGYGTTAGWREPFVAGTTANNAPQPSATLAIFRRDCGAQESNTNNVDVAHGAPSPRNSATPADGGLTGIGSVLPYLLEELQTCSLRMTPRLCGTSALNAGTTVTADLSSIGGSAAQSLFDDGTNGDDQAGDGLYMFSATVATGTALGSHALPVTFSDGGGNSGGAYLLLFVNPTSTPDNDNCATALAITGTLPQMVADNITGATVESNPFANSLGTPTTGMGARRGVWYSVAGTGNTMTASLCGTIPVFDSVMFVLCGTCDGLTVVANNDDFCATFDASQVTWCSTAGTNYWIWIGHFNAGPQTNAYTLTVSDNATPCAGAAACLTCPAPDGSWAIREVEAGYGTSTNDGCDTSPNFFTDITEPGASSINLAGAVRGMAGNRDTDWYRWQAVTTGAINARVYTQTSLQVSFFQLSATGGCPATNLANSVLPVRCGSAAVAAPTVTAGNWYAVRAIQVGLSAAPAGAIFGGTVPGGLTYSYVITLSTTAPGETFCEPGLEGVMACPCGNAPSGPGRGCDNSDLLGGATLTDVGTASLAADTVVFTTTDERPTALSIVLQGNAYVNAGIAFGDAVRCVGGSLKRLYLKSAVAGSITAPGGGDPTVSAQSATLGDVITPGTTRGYQVYYRDPPVFACAAETFNATHGRRMIWYP